MLFMEDGGKICISLCNHFSIVSHLHIDERQRAWLRPHPLLPGTCAFSWLRSVLQIRNNYSGSGSATFQSSVPDPDS